MKKVISVVLVVLTIGLTVNTSVFASGGSIHPIYTCNVCGREATYYESEPATCQKEGYIELSCHTYITPIRECMVVISETDATCTEPGEKRRYCLLGCDRWDEITITSPALGHQITHSNNAIPPTCTEDGKSSSYTCNRYDYWGNKCNYEEEGEVIPALGHEFEEYNIPATCTQEGKKGGSYCTRSGCDEVVEEPTIISPTGHTIVEDPMVYPTCTETGLTKGKHCTTCGEIFLEQKVLKVSAHKGKTTGKKSATYFAKGHTGKTVCMDCGEVISKGKTTAKKQLKTPTTKYTGGKKKIKVRYTKVKDATGFQVKYKLGKKSITKTYTTKKTITKTIKNLKKGTYKVQVRAFVKSGSKKAYSSWTKVKTVKVK